MERTATLPDGRALVATRDGPLDPWAVRVATEERVVTKRWLLAAIAELLELPRGPKDDWVDEAVRWLSGHDTPWGRRFPCPCCDFLTLDDPPTGTYEICPVCWWEDDNVQYDDPDYEGGANTISLREARKNFRDYGASQFERQERVRPPYPEEMPA